MRSLEKFADKQGVSIEVTKEIVEQFIELIGDKMTQREKI